MTTTLTEKRARLRKLIAQVDLDEQLRRRATQQAILSAEAWHWAKRAEEFHAAAPRKGDYHGRAAREDLREVYDGCMATALACRRKAAFLEWETAEPLVDPAWEVDRRGQPPT